MKIGITISLIVLVLAMWTCKGTKKTTDGTETKKEKPTLVDMSAGTGKILAEMSKSACFGKCPVYTLKIMDNGKLSYHGVMHTEKMGVYSRMLPVDSFNQIVQAIVATNLWQFEDVYTSELTDLPKTTITHYQGDASKSVKGDHERPEPVQLLEAVLKQIANSGVWTQEEMEVPYNSIKGEIIVDLLPEFKAKDLETQFAEQGLMVKNRIAPDLNLWLLSFDEEKVNPGRMAVLLKNHRAVKMVDFNKKLDSRR